MNDFSFTALPPLSLYIHIPWCVRKCPYCDFNSHAVKDELPETAYTDALLADLEQSLPGIWGRTVETVFIGGGTPSLLSANAIDRLLSGIRARLAVKPDAEITLEANPGTFEQEKFRDFYAAGINRLSIGIQSFNAACLQALGRIHNDTEAHRAVELARTAGFDNINLDLMFGLPGQDVAGALADLQLAIDKQPAHISWYQLTLEPNTLFYHQPPVLPDSELKWAMQQQGQLLLEKRGYTQYEVSAYAQRGRRCRHNLNYWRFGDYLGIGAGAHGKISDAASQSIQRHSKRRQPADYLAATERKMFTDTSRILSSNETVFEFMLNSLRLKEGIDRDVFTVATGLPFSTAEARVNTAIDADLLAWQAGRLVHTDRGWRFLDDLVAGFLPGD